MRSTRPPQYAGRIDLRQRRTWRADGDAPADDRGLPEWVKDPEKAYAEIQKLRQNEAAARQSRKELDDLKAQLRARDLDALRLKVSIEAQLPPALAERLKGETEADLKADAEALRALIPAQAAASAPGGRQEQTTTVPGGRPTHETDAQRRARVFGGANQMFQGGGVVYHGDPADLD